jgi:hypothetical protein
MITLKNVLLINAVSSGFTGLALIVAPQVIASLLEIAYPGVVFGVGVFLLAFSIGVYVVSRKTEPSRKAVESIVIMDSLWVVSSIAVVLFHLATESFLGNFIVTAIALWVALMAILQYKGMKTLPISR